MVILWFPLAREAKLAAVSKNYQSDFGELAGQRAIFNLSLILLMVFI